MKQATLPDVVRRAFEDLRAIHAAGALIGGLAVGARVLERMTRDVDITISTDSDREAERVVRELSGRGYSIRTVLEQVDTGRLSTVRLTTPLDGATMVDLLFVSSGIEAEVVQEAGTLDVGGVTCAVAQRGHLVALKG